MNFILKQDQGSKAPSTSAFHQLNNELSMYIQYLICIPRVLDQHQIVTSKNRDISLNEKQLFHENNPSIEACSNDPGRGASGPGLKIDGLGPEY